MGRYDNNISVFNRNNEWLAKVRNIELNYYDFEHEGPNAIKNAVARLQGLSIPTGFEWLELTKESDGYDDYQYLMVYSVRHATAEESSEANQEQLLNADQQTQCELAEYNRLKKKLGK